VLKYLPSSLRSVSRLLVLLIALAVAGVIALAVGSGYLYFTYIRDLPDIGSVQNFSPPVVSEVFASDGTRIGEFWTERRLLVPYEEIPPLVINAFVASEDSRFFEHQGVDFRSVLRAFIKNLKAGRVVQGGSTITQQVARSLLLTRERTYERKIKEAILATRIEQSLSKSDILYLYLNQIYLGNRSYGIRSAAWNYFRKPLEYLELAEITMLAGLPSAPSDFAPTRNPELAKKHQKQVLERMVDAQYITVEQADDALAATLKIYHAPTDKEFNARIAPYFTEHVRREVKELYGIDMLYRGGLKVYTTLDLKSQKAAQRALQEGLRRLDKRQGFRGPLEKLAPNEWDAYAEGVHQEITAKAKDYFYLPPPPERLAIATPLQHDQLYKGIITRVHPDRSLTVRVGNVSGRISYQDRKWVWRPLKAGWIIWVRLKELAYNQEVATSLYMEQEPRVEGAIYSMDPRSGEIKALVGGYDFKRSEFNRATQALRQPGSAFKPITYAAALDKGYTPQTTIEDAPVTYQVGKEEFWSPQNYGRKFSGKMDFAAAIKHSVNVIAVKIFHDVGIHYVMAYAHKLGLRSSVRPYLSSALGATDVHLDEMVRVYSTFPTLGIRPNPNAIRKILDKSGQVVQQRVPLPADQASVPSSHEDDRLNSNLIATEAAYIKARNLQLAPNEMRILYGARIPSGHVMTPQTAFVMSRLLKNVVDGGTGHRARIPNWEIGGKTGTTNNETDAWFIGFTANRCTGVWVGYENKKGLGKGMTGGVVAAPIWKEYMAVALADQEPIRLPVPNGTSAAMLSKLTGGSAIFLPKREELVDEGDAVPEGVTPTRASDFLFEDLNQL